MRICLDQEGWYRRIENNGWRPVAYTHLLQANMEQYYCSDDYQKSAPFSHSKVGFFLSSMKCLQIYS
jgi:hypothetical protein